MTPSRTYRLDRTVGRFGDVVVGGSPLKLFRLTAAGRGVVDRLAAGRAVEGSTLVNALLDAGAIHPDPRAPGTTFTPADVTIVVPSLGPPAHLPDGALLIDDGSRPALHGAAIRLPHNRGPGAARNAGLATVTTALVAFVDGDVELPPDWLTVLLPHFDDPLVALVAPRVTTIGHSAIERYESAHSPLDLGADAARIRAGTRVGYVPAAAILCRVDALREVGGFDAALRFGEDVDLVWRLDEAGWRCRYEPAVEVHHAARPDWAAWVRQRIDYGSSSALLARRHPGALAPLRMSGWSVASWLLVTIGRPLLGATVAVGSASTLVRKLPDVPAREAFRLAAVGNLRAGDQIADAIRRAWWPLLALAAWRSTTARRALVGAAIAARNPVRLVDDIAASIGVWKGVLSQRAAGPLVPQIVSWPATSRRWPCNPSNYRRSS